MSIGHIGALKTKRLLWPDEIQLRRVMMASYYGHRRSIVLMPASMPAASCGAENVAV